MKSIKEILECSKCGCIVLPDATKCPKCGSAYDGNGVGTMIDNVNYSSKPKIGETGIEVIVAYYQFSCPRHGRINVRAMVTASTVKCPFC